MLQSKLAFAYLSAAAVVAMLIYKMTLIGAGGWLVAFAP